MSQASRPYEVVVFGATGFTGGLTAEYLARHAPADLRWAIAGRSQPKLDALRQRLLALAGGAREIATLQASVDDAASVSRMAAQTKVLLTTVGPFADYGEPVARACIEQGTDYVDSTGEPAFVDMLLERYAAEAEARGVRLVSCCGLDAIPTDLGAFFTVAQLPEGQPIRMSGYLQLQARFSGGTERSAIKALGTTRPVWPPPSPKATSGRHVEVLAGKVERIAGLGWVSPMPTIDGPIAVRSAAALDRYGPDFRYAHHAVHGSLGVLLLTGVFFGMLALLVRIAPIRTLILKFAKRSGEGPSEEVRAKSWFKLRFIAEGGGKKVQTEVAGGDPGYGETSKMLAESALCLARDTLPQRAGVLTPAQAMGEQLLERLQRAGLSFRVL